MSFKSNLDSGSIKPQMEEYALPSSGITYRTKGKKFPNTVQVRPYSFITEGILDSNLMAMQKMRDICKAVVVNFPPDFNWDTLLVADQMVILALARALTYGENYKFESNCPNCNFRELHTIQVPQELPVRKWTFETPEAFDIACSTKLPHCQDEVRVKFLTMQDEITLSQQGQVLGEQSSAKVIKGGDTLKKTSALPENARSYVTRIASQIAAVNHGPPDDLAEAIAYVTRLEGKDKIHLEDFLRDASCGIDFQWNVHCENGLPNGQVCGRDYQTVVPIGLDFFRRNRV